MGMGGCYSVLKYLVFTINLIFWISGISLIVVAIWLLTDPVFTSMAQDQLNNNIGFFLLIVGIFLFIVGFLGCCGILKESKVLLVLFFCLLLLILVAEISAAVWAHYNQQGFNALVQESVKKTVTEEYGEDESRTLAFDAIQRDLGCCGAKGPYDWLANPHSSKDKALDMTRSSTANYKLPRSCCRGEIPNKACKSFAENNWVYVNFIPNFGDDIYPEGCAYKLLNVFYSYSTCYFIVGFLLILIQLCGLIFSLIICCSMQKPHYSAINTRNRL